MQRILIVDDYASGRHVLRVRLEMRGYICQEVEDGAAALKAMKTNQFDLIITDHEMPVMTGLEFLHQLAKKPESQRPPVIFVTGNQTHIVHQAAQKAGAHAVLTKPYEDQELMIEITRILEPQLIDNSKSIEHECRN